MPADIIKLGAGGDRREILRRAARVLREGGLVVFPTETVYGVGASAANSEAVRRLQALKSPAAESSFTVHVARAADAARYVNRLGPISRRLMKKAWPGPLTLLLPVDDPAATSIHADLSAEGRSAIYRDGQMGIRCPDDPVAADLLAAAEAPVIATGANRPGRPTSTEGETAAAELAESVDLILDGGRCRYGRPSTIVRVIADRYELLREGVYDARTLRRLATLNLLFVCSGNTCRSPIAEGLSRIWIAEKLGLSAEALSDRGIVVQSCGTGAFDGSPATAEAVDVCARRGVDISRHRSQPLTPELIRSADHIFTMTESHRRAVISKAPEAAERTRRLSDGADISDPMGGTHEEYHACAQIIWDALERSLKEVDL